MAILHHKEEKIQAVLGRLPKTYTHEQFVEMFIKLYSKDWGKIKSAYIKQSQDKEPGTIITMPKPDLYLKQLLETYVKANNVSVEVIKEKSVKPESKEKLVAKTKKPEVEKIETAKKPKSEAKKKADLGTSEEPVKKTKSAVKKVILTSDDQPIKESKPRAKRTDKVSEK